MVYSNNHVGWVLDDFLNTLVPKTLSEMVHYSKWTNAYKFLEDTGSIISEFYKLIKTKIDNFLGHPFVGFYCCEAEIYN